jgi:hypothetical protein
MRNWFIPIACSVAWAAQAAPPQRVEIVYEVTRNGTALAEVTERLEHDQRQYRLEESWKGKGVFALRGEARRSSRGKVASDGLRPVEFEDHRPGREPRRLAFDPGTAVPALQQQDRLSFLWTFVFVPPKGETAVRVANEKDKNLSTQVYQTAGRERLRVAAGEFDTLKLVKKKVQPDDKTTEIWLAADKAYLPVKILIIEKDGTRLEQTAVRIETP